MGSSLQPCPFCGSQDGPQVIPYAKMVAMFTSHPSLRNGYYIICDAGDGRGCGAHSGYARTEDKAALIWNKRRFQ